MSLFGDIARGTAAIGAAPWTGGASLALWPGATKRGQTSAPGYAPGKPRTAKDIAIPSGLSDALGGIAPAGKKAISGNYSDLSAGLGADASARGLRASSNSYAPGRLETQQGLDIGALESALGGVAGNAAYGDFQAQNDYNQNLSLVDEIAALNKKTPLEQALEALGAVGPTAATFAAMKGRGAPSSQVPNAAGSLSPNLSLFDPYSSGIGRYR